MNPIALALLLTPLIGLPWIFKNPFVGLILVILLTPFEALVQLPFPFSLGRIAGGVAVGCWIVNLATDPNAAYRFKNSKLKSVIWAFPLTCFVSLFLNSFDYGVVSGLSQLTKVVILSTLALMTENQASNRERVNVLMLAMAASAAITVFFPLAYYFGLDAYSLIGYSAEDSIENLEGRVKGLTNNANALGMAGSMGIIAVVTAISGMSGEKRKIFTPILVTTGLACLGGIILAQSRTHLITAASYVVVFAVLSLTGPGIWKTRAYALLAILAVLAPAIWIFSPEDARERFDLTENKSIERLNFSEQQRDSAFDILMDHPIFGCGLGNTKTASKKGYDVHDSVSQIIGETGIAGTLTITLLIFFGFKNLRISTKYALELGNLSTYGYSIALTAGLVATLICGLGGYLFVYQKWFWLTLGLSRALINQLEFEHEQMIRNYQPMDGGDNEQLDPYEASN